MSKKTKKHLKFKGDDQPGSRVQHRFKEKLRDEPLRFSFRFFGAIKGLSLTHAGHDYVFKLFERLKALEGMTAGELMRNRSSALRCHPVDYESSSVNKDYSLQDFFRDVPETVQGDPYQFAVSSNEYGRVHGWFVGATFFVRWLDPEHKVYPGK